MKIYEAFNGKVIEHEGFLKGDMYAIKLDNVKYYFIRALDVYDSTGRVYSLSKEKALNIHYKWLEKKIEDKEDDLRKLDYLRKQVKEQLTKPKVTKMYLASNSGITEVEATYIEKDNEYRYKYNGYPCYESFDLVNTYNYNRQSCLATTLDIAYKQYKKAIESKIARLKDDAENYEYTLNKVTEQYKEMGGKC